MRKRCWISYHANIFYTVHPRLNALPCCVLDVCVCVCVCVCLCLCGWTPRLRYQSGCPNSQSPSSTFTASAINRQIRLECKRSSNQSICVCVCARKQFNYTSQSQVKELNWCLNSPHSVWGNINHNILPFIKKQFSNQTVFGRIRRRGRSLISWHLKDFVAGKQHVSLHFELQSDFTCKLSTKQVEHLYHQVFTPNRKWTLVSPTHYTASSPVLVQYESEPQSAFSSRLCARLCAYA